ncbi:MAG TPA: hypothetical protein VK932_08245, partial [Kofleriaceae bacterium]|nr:hypothetical protein [Kofleriaceae bacterium]
MLALAACGARPAPQPSWIELDASRGSDRHEVRPPGAAAADPAAAAVPDLAKLAGDPALIDTLDEPAVLAALARAGTAAPAARLAHRAARLAYHRGDAAAAR